MKNRLNLTIDPAIIAKGKRLAAQENKSLSEMVEEMIKKVPEGEEPLFMKMVREAQLKGPFPETKKEMREEYYESRRKKYGL